MLECDGLVDKPLAIRNIITVRIQAVGSTALSMVMVVVSAATNRRQERNKALIHLISLWERMSTIAPSQKMTYMMRLCQTMVPLVAAVNAGLVQPLKARSW